MKPKTIVVTVKGMISDSDLNYLRRYSDVVYAEKEVITQEELAKLVKGFDYLMLNYDVVKKLDESFYSSQNVKKLKSISFDITGMDWATPPVAIKHKIQLQNTPGYSTISVSESILCEVLLHSRKIHEAYDDLLKGKKPVERKGINLKGRTAGVIGLGPIGLRTAELLLAIGMNVTAWNRTKKEVKGIRMKNTIADVFGESDVVCICLKTVPQTEKIINENVLSKAKKGLILVNLAGKKLVDHNALFNNIQNEKIGGYSVTLSEETKSHKIASLSCVHMPPANAWLTDESLNELKRIWMDNIITAIENRPQNVLKD